MIIAGFIIASLLAYYFIGTFFYGFIFNDDSKECKKCKYNKSTKEFTFRCGSASHENTASFFAILWPLAVVFIIIHLICLPLAKASKFGVNLGKKVNR